MGVFTSRKAAKIAKKGDTVLTLTLIEEGIPPSSLVKKPCINTNLRIPGSMSLTTPTSSRMENVLDEEAINNLVPKTPGRLEVEEQVAEHSCCKEGGCVDPTKSGPPCKCGPPNGCGDDRCECACKDKGICYNSSADVKEHETIG